MHQYVFKAVHSRGMWGGGVGGASPLSVKLNFFCNIVCWTISCSYGTQVVADNLFAE